MGMTLMADDRDLIIGEIRGVQSQVLRRLEKQDEEDVRRDREREERHAQNVARLDQVDQALDGMNRKLTTTFGLAAANERWVREQGTPAIEWIEQHGKPLVNRVKVLEGVQAAAEETATAVKNRRLGALAVMTLVGSGLGALAAIIGFIGLDGLAGLLARAAKAMGAP